MDKVFRVFHKIHLLTHYVIPGKRFHRIRSNRTTNIKRISLINESKFEGEPKEIGFKNN